mmetsp:Transcript_17432/g.12441  ORF Transcript_17432/g.12441 Transcript_17432/m.12441 type:complete len:116 (-) Transcript_17432:641-988(-)
MFAILGVFGFHSVEEGNVISRYKNFKNFGQSFLLLFAISTGEDWNRLMYDCAKATPLAYIYFIMFVMLVSHVMLNLFILVIIEQFDNFYVSEDNPLKRFSSNLSIFQQTWNEFTQ